MNTKRIKTFVVAISVIMVAFIGYSLYQQNRNIEFGEGSEKSSLSVGMSKDEVISNWGSPDSINRVKDKKKTRETWVYYKNRENPIYLKFQNGVLKKYSY